VEHGITAKNEYHSRVCVLMFPVGGDPLHALCRVDGSNDLVVNYPSVLISAHAEPIGIDGISLDYPLQPIR